MTRSPPTRAELMASNAIQVANNPLFGYSQKPPSGRWGPDFDCSSLMYFLAKLSGFDVETGGDKVRYTGTMLKDFALAGVVRYPTSTAYNAGFNPFCNCNAYGMAA